MKKRRHARRPKVKHPEPVYLKTKDQKRLLPKYEQLYLQAGLRVPSIRAHLFAFWRNGQIVAMAGIECQHGRWLFNHAVVDPVYQRRGFHLALVVYRMKWFRGYVLKQKWTHQIVMEADVDVTLKNMLIAGFAWTLGIKVWENHEFCVVEWTVD